MKKYTIKQLRDELLEIEADTYAEFVRAGKLNNKLSPFLKEVLQSEE